LELVNAELQRVSRCKERGVSWGCVPIDRAGRRSVGECVQMTFKPSTAVIFMYFVFRRVSVIVLDNDANLQYVNGIMVYKVTSKYQDAL
jgi:hypothetical protein